MLYPFTASTLVCNSSKKWPQYNQQTQEINVDMLLPFTPGVLCKFYQLSQYSPLYQKDPVQDHGLDLVVMLF